MLRRDDGEYVYHLVLYYLASAIDNVSDLDSAVEAIRSAVDPEVENKAMNGLEILEKRGEKRGEKRSEKLGERRTRIDVVTNMLEAGMSVDEIVRVTRIDRGFVQAIADGGTPEIQPEPDSETDED